MGFFEFRRQLEYNAKWGGRLVVVAGRWFPPSKSCLIGRTVQEKMLLAVYEWRCPDCGSLQDREVNAAKNLLAYG